MTHDLPADDAQLLATLRNREFSCLIPRSIEANGGERIGRLLLKEHDLYEPLLLATASHPRPWFDWNVGFIIPHLDMDRVAGILADNRIALARSEGVAWGLGEAGSDDDRIVDHLYFMCESCDDYDAWWCAAEALEKLIAVDATDLKKRTLRGEKWTNLEHCLQNLDERPAIIGVLRCATMETVRDLIIPSCRQALSSDGRKQVQNAVWLLERLRVDDVDTLTELYGLYEQAEDLSHTLRPRVVEAFGRIAAPSTRPLLEAALLEAVYYRTRSYAAMGLGKIGDSRSVEVLERALHSEEDARVLPHITSAIYAIRDSTTRVMNQAANAAEWPENGMIVDESNKWYATPEIYDKFSQAEDPLGVSLEYALSLFPESACEIADLGTGTGRFAFFVAERCPSVELIHAVDLSEVMCDYLTHRLRFSARLSHKIRPHCADIGQLPFPDRSLDALVSTWGFPSNMWKKESCLREVREARRVLKDGGRLITVGSDETFRDQLSELWYRFVPEPDFRRESIEQWRRRRRQRLTSARNCHLTWAKRQFKVPLLFDSPTEAATVLGHLFGFSAGEWVSQQRRCEFSISVGITCDDTASLQSAIARLESETGAWR